jgi:hypothetical protein
VSLLNDSAAIKYSYLCAALGIATFIIHSAFIALGYHQFNLPLSFLIIALCLFSSLYLLRKISNQGKGGEYA